MSTNEQLIHTFYQAFQKRDYASMQACYADKATFNDEAFKNLNAAQARKMWEMLITRGKDLQLEYKNVQVDGQAGSAEWIATYSFSKTNRKVVNHIKANFVFEDGKIIQHIDQFDFHKWSRQALGPIGLFLGWTSFLQNKVSTTAMQNLESYMQKHPD